MLHEQGIDSNKYITPFEGCLYLWIMKKQKTAMTMTKMIPETIAAIIIPVTKSIPVNEIMTTMCCSSLVNGVVTWRKPVCICISDWRDHNLSEERTRWTKTESVGEIK